MKIMMMKRRTFLLNLLFACLTLFSLRAGASCSLTLVTQTEDSYVAQIPFGKINLTDTYLQPVGTMLASIVVPPTNYTHGGANGASVLWECDAADLPNIYFLVATNGDDRVGGFYDIGTVDGLSDVYATWFAYVGIRQTMSGVTLTRHWQKVPITSYATSSTGRIQIRLQDIPPLVAELYRISSLPGTSAASAYCGNNNDDGVGIGYASATGRNYFCQNSVQTQPNAYIQLSGDSSVSFSFARDFPGEDSAYNYDFWGADNGFGYGMRLANTLYSLPTCVARNATPQVLFRTISIAELEQGGSASASFTVQVECSDSAESGTAAGQTAIGIQVSPGSYSAASKLGLVNGSGGVTYLLSDDYFGENMAQGVGITLQNAQGKRMNFVGQPGTVSLTTPGGENAGWYPVLEAADNAGSTMAGYTHYSSTFLATLQKLDGQAVTPGKVYATAYVLVKIQ